MGLQYNLIRVIGRWDWPEFDANSLTVFFQENIMKSKICPRRAGGFLAAILLLFQFAATNAVAAMSGPNRWKFVDPPSIDPTFGMPRPKVIANTLGKPPFWIWAASVSDHQSVFLRKSLILKTMPTKPLVYVTADNYFTLYINGKKVAGRQTNSMAWSQVYRINVAAYLHTGRNEFAMKATNDGGPAGAILWLISAGHTLLKTDGSWQESDHPKRRWQTGRGQSHWKLATVETSYGGGPWGDALAPWPDHAPYLFHLFFQPEHVTVIQHPGAFSGLHSVARMLTPENRGEIRPGYRGTSLLAPAHRIALRVNSNAGDPEILLDFGQEVAGRIQVQGAGGIVLIGTGESRGEALHGPWGGWHSLSLNADQTESTPYSAFRYAAVRFSGPGPIRLDRLRLDFKYYPVKYRGAFACSDSLLTKIWYTGAYTSHLCMQENIWDAPKRDRAMWMGDLQVSGEVINNVFLDHFLMEQTMRRLRAQAQGGNSPTALPTNDVNGIPGYSCAWICGLEDFYRHTGAITYIRSQHLLLLSMLRYMKQAFNANNLFVNGHNHWCFTDWSRKLHGNAPQSYEATDLYTCMAVKRAVVLLRAMGDTANARRYARWDKTLIIAARKYSADSRTGTFTDLRDVNAMAIDSGVADPAQRRAIKRYILGPDCPSWKQIDSPYYNNFVLFALGRLGLTNQGLRFVRSYWGGMIHEGATTFWEGYDPSWPKVHIHQFLQADWVQGYFVSMCHGWSCGVTNWLTQYILGVNSTGQGFASVRIVPHPGDLHWISGRVPTPQGNILVMVRRSRSAESIHVSLPAGVRAKIGIRGQNATINGKKARIIKGQGLHNFVKIPAAHSRSILEIISPTSGN